MSVRIRLVTDDSGFAALRGPWADLWERAHDANTFLSFEWLNTWWESYRPPAELRLLVAEDGGRLMGVAPMMAASERRSFVPCRVLRFVGDGSYETDHMNLVVDSARRAELVPALLDALDKEAWDLLCLNQMPEKSEITAAALAWAAGKGYLVDSLPSPCPMRTLPGSYDDMLKTMQSRFRTSLRSSRRKASEKYKLEFGLHEDPAEFESALESLFKNHASRWAAKGQAGIFVKPEKRALYRRLTGELHARGWLRFFYMKFDGRIVAQEYCFERAGVVYLLQEGFDYAHSAENIGNTLRGFVMEELIRRGAKTYDFLAGTSRHKGLWGNLVENDLRIEIARPTLKARAAFQVPRLVEAFKEKVKRVIRKPAQAVPPPGETEAVAGAAGAEAGEGPAEKPAPKPAPKPAQKQGKPKGPKGPAAVAAQAEGEAPAAGAAGAGSEAGKPA